LIKEEDFGRNNGHISNRANPKNQILNINIPNEKFSERG
jgi:hypothetical protein